MTRDRFDRDALARGLLLAAVIAVPVGLLASGLDDDSWAVVPLSFVVLLGLVAGAAVAGARQDRGLPLSHGLVTAIAAVVLAQLIGTFRRLAIGEDLHAGRVASNLLLAIIAGTIGGLIGSRRGSRGTPRGARS